MKFSLDDYFYGTKQTYHFIDGLIKWNKELKKDVLRKVDIYDSSYRSDRSKYKVCNNNRFILLNYFGYFDVKLENKENYEICLSKAYYAYYYSDIIKAKDIILEIETIIEDNNTLKPIFVLFKVLLKILLINVLDKLRLDVREDLAFLGCFKDKYYQDNFYSLYLVVKSYIEPNKQLANKVEAHLHNHKEFNWLYNIFRGSLNYIDEKYEQAIIYYTNAMINLSENKFNLNRIIRLTINICACYNDIELYAKSLEISSKNIEFMCYSKLDFTKEMLMHYLFSLYMLDFYNDIINFTKVTPIYEYLNVISAIILLLVANKLNDTDILKQLKNINESILSEKNYCCILNFLKTKDSSYLKNLLDVPYMRCIKNKIIKNM